MGEPLDIRPLGDGAVTIRFGDRIAPEIHARVRGFCAALAENPIDGVEDIAPAFASATIWYDPDRLDFTSLCARLRDCGGAERAPMPPGRLIEAVFCADDEFAPDLPEVAALHHLTPQAYLDQFCARIFAVYMLGFLPGFAYLGVLPPELSAPRLMTPRPKIPAGSLAIADGMCAAYPSDSPGGWRLIGRTPLRLFDPARAKPSFFAPGERVCWRQISRDEFSAAQAGA